MRRRITDVAGVMPQDKLLVSVEEAAALLSVGRSVVYDLLLRNELRSVRFGRRRCIVASSLREYVERVAA